jgi:hypothetical protein
MTPAIVAAVIAVANDKTQRSLRPRKASLWIYIKTVVSYLMLPAELLQLFCLLFENPPTGR